MTSSRCVAFGLLALTWVGGVFAATPAINPNAAKSQGVPALGSLFKEGKSYLDAQDFLGFRVFIKKAYNGKLTHGTWLELKRLVNASSSKAGFDLVILWNARNQTALSAMDRRLAEGDRLMLAGDFPAAFAIFQSVAQKLKDGRSPLYPHILQAMGRALFSSRRFDEALKLYEWIPSSYPQFRQVLFEKMWAAFRAGRVDLALGAIASQRSAYFNRFLPPEAYLIQVYLYKKTCRDQELRNVTGEMRKYQAELIRANFRSWAEAELDRRVLLGLTEVPAVARQGFKASRKEREAEQELILKALKKAYETNRPKIIADLRSALAYSELAETARSVPALKPVRHIRGRDELLRMNLEIWPATDTEEWADEVGKHEFMGESQCSARAGR